MARPKPVVNGRRRMADVSPMMTHEAGAGPSVKPTEMIKPRAAWAKFDDSDTATDPAIPRQMSRMVLASEPHR